MKGIFFTELIDLVEENFGYEVADQMIEGCSLASGGAYTAIGSYDHHELVQLVNQLNLVTGREVPELFQLFGRHLFGRLMGRYPDLFAVASDSFSFFAQLDNYFHGTMSQLYPDTQIPHFEFTQRSASEVELTYRSTPHLADMTEGLIRGCIAHFCETLVVRRETQVDAVGTVIRFYLAHPAHPSRGAD